MSLWLLALTGTTLVLTTSVAALPQLLRNREPRAQQFLLPAGAPSWLVVRSKSGSWYVNGEPVPPNTFAQSLGKAPPGGPIRFLASSAMSAGEVSGSLAWLRSHSRQPVMLELAP